MQQYGCKSIGKTREKQISGMVYCHGDYGNHFQMICVHFSFHMAPPSVVSINIAQSGYLINCVIFMILLPKLPKKIKSCFYPKQRVEIRYFIVLSPSSRRQATVHRTVAFTSSNLPQLPKKEPTRRVCSFFGGECEIRTHGGFPHHQFSRLAP